MTRTLGFYEKTAAILFGRGSKSHDFITRKIAASPKGADEKVLADEQQMLALFAQLEGVNNRD